jgi:proline iminopeptidase
MQRGDFLRAGLALCAAPAFFGAAAPPAPVWFPTADGPLAYARFGGGGRLLVFLMGGPGLDPNLAMPVVEDLASENEVVVLHQRGTGASYDARLTDADLTVAGAVADLDALRTALHREALDLVGQSWGSMLSMAYAAAHPARVDSLALLNPGGPNLGFMRGFGRRVMAKLTPAERAAYAKAGLVTPEQLRLELLGDVHDRANIGNLLDTLGPRTANQRVFTGLMRDAQKHYDVRAALAGFAKPVLLLFGDDDPSLAAKDDLVALFPNAQIATIPAAGHLGWLDQPVAYRDAVLGFTRSLNRVV